MGLPLFITPVEPQALTKSPEKMAAAPRSAIRRRPTMARSRQHPASLRRRLLGSLEHSREEAYQIWEGNSRRHTGEPEPNTASSLHIRAQRILEDERAAILAREPPSLVTQSTGNSESDGPAMPAVPEPISFARSQERFQAAQRFRQTRDQLRRMTRRHAAPTPPYLDEDLEIHGGRDFGETHRTFYHTYGPSQVSAFDVRNSPPESSLTLPPITALPFAQSPVPQSGSSSPRRPQADEPEPFTSFLSRMDQRRSSLTDRIEVLTRTSNAMARSRIRQARIRQATHDGLGDRNRSLSPEGGAAWDTLLTSITPDPQPPSVGSSFASTSATAATASLSSSGPSSTNTSMTSSRETREPALRDCDLSEGSNTDEEDEDDMYELREFNSSRSRGPWRTYANAVGPESYATTSSLTADPEHLDGMHHIISRLAERDEIPEQWWASAGLSRNLRREPST